MFSVVSCLEKIVLFIYLPCSWRIAPCFLLPYFLVWFCLVFAVSWRLTFICFRGHASWPDSSHCDTVRTQRPCGLRAAWWPNHCHWNLPCCPFACQPSHEKCQVCIQDSHWCSPLQETRHQEAEGDGCRQRWEVTVCCARNCCVLKHKLF